MHVFFYERYYIYQEDLHLDTNMGDKLYLGSQIFIHHNLVQHKVFTLFMWHPAIKLLLYMTTILETSICYSMARGEGSTLLIGLHGSYVFFHVFIFYTLHTKYLTLEFFLCLVSKVFHILS